jgi:hypothetical protein
MALHCYLWSLERGINGAAAIISLNNYNTDSYVTPIRSGRGPPGELFDKEWLCRQFD